MKCSLETSLSTSGTEDFLTTSRLSEHHFHVGLIPVWKSWSLLKDLVNEYLTNRTIEYYCLVDNNILGDVVGIVKDIIITPVNTYVL